jgi:hypothetical protein
MQELSSEGLKFVDDVARRHGVGSDAVAALLRALALGNGAQAQFNHPALGGMGQWFQGGMIMIGDMFNQASNTASTHSAARSPTSCAVNRRSTTPMQAILNRNAKAAVTPA